MRIVFFGTPSFAEVSLRALLDAGHDLVGVVTQPDKPQGRSRSVLVPPPVKVLAESRGLRLLQPEKPAGDVFLAALRRFKPDLGVVVAYGHILRQQVLDIPRLGMINVHASLLPKLRGAAPIQWALAGGETETGVSIMRMEAGLDSGPVYAQARINIVAGDTGGSLTSRLAELGAQTLVELLPAIAKGSARATPQDHAAATYAPKLSREAALVDWTADAGSIARRICAFDPVPGAWTRLGTTDIKLFHARAALGAGEPGEVLHTGDRILVAAGEGAVEVGEVQPAGRRRAAAGEWIRGRGVAQGQRFA
jgi:methionyl-tRNA formyltransferase